MDGQMYGGLAKTLALKTSRRRALTAVAGGASGTTFTPQSSPRRPAAGRPSPDPVAEAGRRLTEAVDHEQVPLPTVRLSLEVGEEREAQ